MLSSSKEYLEALRAGKYLRFLEWPHFLTQHYYKDKAKADCDDLLSLIVFDWLNNGFCMNDAKEVALLHAVCGLESRPLRGKLDYSVTTLSIAVVQCMVYESKGLKQLFIMEGEKSSTEIIQLMKSTTICLDLDKSTFQTSIDQQHAEFFKWSSTANAGLVEAARQKISAITATRYILEDYLFSLEATKLPDDPFKLSRLSVANSLAAFLMKQTELTPEVTEQIAVYVNKIRDMKPSEFEKEYLNSILPLSLVDNTWRVVSTLSVTFFNLLQKPDQGGPPAAKVSHSGQ